MKDTTLCSKKQKHPLGTVKVDANDGIYIYSKKLCKGDVALFRMACPIKLRGNR